MNKRALHSAVQLLAVATLLLPLLSYGQCSLQNKNQSSYLAQCNIYQDKDVTLSGLSASASRSGSLGINLPSSVIDNELNSNNGVNALSIYNQQVQPIVMLEHSPKRAVLSSALLPGLGQIYNRQAWKVPIIYAAFAATGYFIWNNYSEMKTFKDEYLYRQQHSGAANLAQYANYPTTNIYNLYESYNRNFQLSIIVAIAVYGINLADAYVFAQLFDFEIDDNISLLAAPSVGMGQPGWEFQLQLKF